jgi:thiamine-phosphate pyrophosphorylase
MRSSAVLAAAAARLNREAGGPAIPALYFFTDPTRTPNPEAIVRRLPAGAAVVYRHFGAADRHWRARRLARICRARGLWFLIGADPTLARSAGAAGVHWPQRLMPKARGAEFALVTATAHTADALASADRAQIDACILGPIFQTASGSGNTPLGPREASRLARGVSVPVIALGGVNASNARMLLGKGFAGLAAVDALALA